MNRLSRAVVVVLVVLAVMVGSAFAFGDFGATRSDSNVESVVSVAYQNNTNLDLSAGLYVHVVGDTVADRELERALVEGFRAEGVDAVAVDELRATYDRPVVVVGHSTWTFDYAPHRGDAAVGWRYLYAQSGNLTQFGSSTPETSDFSAAVLTERLTGDGFETVVLTEGVEVVSEGEFTLADETTGLQSLPNYDRHVRTVVADATVDALLAVRR